MHNDAVKVAYNQQGRTLQCIAVPQQLIVCRGKILALALVFHAEKIFLPNIREAVAAPVLGRALLKAECRAGGIACGRGGMVENVAEVNKMLLRGGPFFQIHLTPLRYEL